MIWGVISHSYLWDFHNPWWSTVSTAPLLTFPLSTAATAEEWRGEWKTVKGGEGEARGEENKDRRKDW